MFHTHCTHTGQSALGSCLKRLRSPSDTRQGKPLPISFSQGRQHFRRLCKCLLLLPALSLLGVIPAVQGLVLWQQHVPLEMRGSCNSFHCSKGFASHLFSSAWGRYADTPHHPVCHLAPQSLMGWKFSLVLASSNADLQKKNRGFISRKEALKI